MTNSVKFKKDRAKILADVEAIEKAAAEKGGYSDEQTAALDKMHKDIAALNQSIARAEQSEGLLKDHKGAPIESEIPDDVTNLRTDGGGIIFKERHYGQARHIGDNRQAHAVGLWLCGIAGNPKARERAAQIFGRDCFQRVNGDFALLQEGQNIYGGYLVPEQLEGIVVDLREKYGLFRRKAKRVPMTSDTWSGSRRVSGLTAYPVGEGAAGTETTKVIDQIKLTAGKWMVLTRMTTEINEDALVSMADDTMQEIGYGFATAEDNAGFVGDGTSTYAAITGLKNALAAGAKVTQITSNTWATQVLADINALEGKVKDYTQAMNQEFYCNKAYYHNVLERLAMAAGGVTSLEIVNGIVQGRFFGFPVNFATPMPSATATTGIMCYFGDLGAAAKFGDRRGITISMSDVANVGGQSMFERDEIGIKGTERFDIIVHERGDATNGGPINALITG